MYLFVKFVTGQLLVKVTQSAGSGRVREDSRYLMIE
nr:MAG TPA: hypothetical protein [Caudoviricetes sp.]